jgi:hypothetical protein
MLRVITHREPIFKTSLATFYRLIPVIIWLNITPVQLANMNLLGLNVNSGTFITSFVGHHPNVTKAGIFLQNIQNITQALQTGNLTLTGGGVPFYIVSDRFVEAVKSAGLTGIEFEPIEKNAYFR